MKLATKHLKCVKCHNIRNNKTLLLTDKAYKNLHEVTCINCSIKWLVCSVHDVRWCSRRYINAQKHVQTVHLCVDTPSFFNTSDNQNHTSLDYDSFNFDDNESVESNCSTVVNKHNSQSLLPESLIERFISCHHDVDFSDYNKKVRRFLTSESNRFGDGIKQLVTCAFSMNSTSTFSQISLREIKYHIKATIFCCSLTASQISKFGELCDMMLHTCINANVSNNSFSTSRIVTSSKDVDRYYLKRSTSIVQNVPIPTIIELDDHAYVSIKEVIQHILYLNIPIDGMLPGDINTNYKGIISSSSPMTGTKICKNIRTEVKNNATSTDITPLILNIILWSDDFEPNHVKQHKKSTWIKTVTIAPPVGCQTSTKHTYVIALGPKDKNHEKLNSFFFQELKNLQKPTYMYCKNINSNIPVVVKIVAISADRPERSALNSMLGHNGISSRRWRYSAYINQKKLKSCKICLKQRFLKINVASADHPHLCRMCYDWNFNHPSMHEPKPENYPKTQHPDSPVPPAGREVLDIENLHPIELSYPLLIQGVQFCFFNCYHGYWTQASAMVYLKSIGINESYGKEKIYQVALKCQSDSSITSSSLFDYITYPVHWNCGASLDQCIDTPMHQIFQGVVKSIIEKTMSWLTKKGTAHYKAFGDYVNTTLQDISDLGLDWCRMEKFQRGRSYSLGGWQAEQYVAFCRCILVIYASIRDVVGNKEIGIDEHEAMIQALLCFVSRVMCNERMSRDIILDYIKCFLSLCDLFESTAYIMHENDAMWFAKGNFLSLLNLPDQIHKFGNLRLYWEGSRERSIQQIKPYLINMRQTSSYFKTKLTHMYVSQVLDSIDTDLYNHFKDEYGQVNDNQYNRYSSFKIYTQADDIKGMIELGKVLSVVYMSLNKKDFKFYVCQYSNKPRTCLLHQISFLDDDGFNKMGLWYAPIEIAVANIGNELTQVEIDNMAEVYGLLYPCISKNFHFKKCYSTICHNWTYRNKHNVLCLPDLSINLLMSLLN